MSLVNRIKDLLGSGDEDTKNALAKHYANRINAFGWDVKNKEQLELALRILQRVDEVAAAEGLIGMKRNSTGFQSAKIF